MIKEGRGKDPDEQRDRCDTRERNVIR